MLFLILTLQGIRSILYFLSPARLEEHWLAPKYFNIFFVMYLMVLAMMTLSQFKKIIKNINAHNWLRIAIDARNSDQFYFILPGGLGTLICAPIENFHPNIKQSTSNMFENGLLIKPDNPERLFSHGYHYFILDIVEYFPKDTPPLTTKKNGVS